VKREKHKNSAGYLDQEDANMYSSKLAAKSTKRNSVTTPLSYRLPRAALAARLEKELFDLWTSKNAGFFHFPVGRDVPLYHDKVSTPISLSDIREKIAHYRYETAAAMIQDVELMARNAAAFNGPQHIIALAANKLVDKLRVSVNHEAVHFGAERDTIRLMEEAIRKKNVQFHRSGNTGLVSSSHGSSSSGGHGSGGNGGVSYKSHTNQHTSSKMLPTVTHSMSPPPVAAHPKQSVVATVSVPTIQKIQSSSSAGDFSISKGLINLSANDLAGGGADDQRAEQEDDVMDSAGLWME
jgi:hypothetical protein